MADRLYTSLEADEILSALRLEIKLEKFVLARMAFALSLASDGNKVPQSANFSGAEIKRPTFIGADEMFMRTLAASVHEKSDISEDEFYSNRSIVKNHIDSGCMQLQKLFT